jgi:hypothetical protein
VVFVRFGDALGVARAGLWPLAMASALVGPVFVTVALAHRLQWPVGDAEPWTGFIVPWTWRAWSAVIGTLLAAFAASVAPPDPRLVRRLTGALARAAVGWGVWVVAALPAAVWLVRLGAASGSVVAARFATGAVLVAAAALVSAALGARAPAAVAGLAGAAVALGPLWPWQS